MTAAINTEDFVSVEASNTSPYWDVYLYSPEGEHVHLNSYRTHAEASAVRDEIAKVFAGWVKELGGEVDQADDELEVDEEERRPIDPLNAGDVRRIFEALDEAAANRAWREAQR